MLSLSLIVVIIGIVMAAKKDNAIATRLVGVAIILLGLSHTCTALRYKLMYGYGHHRRGSVVIVR